MPGDRSPDLHADVTVVGGGPAGSAAALTLARAGRTVTLVDRACFPRDKTCGDGLTTSALRLLEGLGLAPETVASWQRVDDIVVRSPSGREATFPLPRDNGTYAAVARRTDLDAAIVDLARSAGVKVLEGHACTGVAEHGDHVEVQVDGVGALRSSWLIAADGMWSPVRKHLGLATPGYRGEWHAFRQYFTQVAPQAASDLVIWFEPDLLPGYAWSFPLPGQRANVGFGIQRQGQRVQDMARMWPRLLERPHIREVLGPEAQPESPHRAWPIPARVDRAVLTSRRTLFAGDAAGATDVLTGEGIGQALLTGILAADAIKADTATDGNGGSSDSIDQAAAVTRRYRRAVKSELMTDHRMSLLLMRVLRHQKSARAAVRIAGGSAWTRRNFARWMFEDYPRAILLTPGRWHRGMLAGPGTFAPA